MRSLFVLVFTFVFFATVSLITQPAAHADQSSEVFLEVDSYSRPLVKSLAVAFLAGRLNESSVELKKRVGEIVVNDSHGIQMYDVEVILNDGTAHVLVFNGLDPVGLAQ